jgi:hypothetical protein
MPLLLKAAFHPPAFPADCPLSLGAWSRPCGFVGSAWLLGTSLLLFLPLESPVTLAKFNWLAVVSSIAFAVGALNWQCNSRFSFVGPKRYDAHVAVVETR